jgi:hypothetical protein
VAAARELLTAALREAAVAAVWMEWSTDDPRCPEYARGLGSPTILVNGEDVAASPHPWVRRDAAGGPCCRVYPLPDGTLVGVPPHALVSAAIHTALEPEAG